MRGCRLRRTVGLACLLAVTAAAACGAADDAPSPAHPSEPGAEPGADPEKLVEQLGSEDYTERQYAYQRLRDLGVAAGPALRARRDDPDLEVQTRARLLLDSPYLDEAQVAFYEFLRTEIGPVMGAASFGPSALKQGAFEGKPFDPEPAKDENDEEIAVDYSMEWLARNQEADGHWDSVKFGAQCEADLEQTAMALLSFLAAGHTEKVGRYKENVRRAVDWLGRRMNDEGSFLDGKDQPVACHAQALAVCALSESISMTRKPERVPVARKALERMVACQSLRDGLRDGWGRAPRSAKPDLFTTAWAVMALKSAKVSGNKELTVSSEVWDGAIRMLDRLDDRAVHGFRHVEGAEVSPQATALGVLVRFLTGGDSYLEASEAYLMPLQKHFERAMEAGDANEGMFIYPFTIVSFRSTDGIWNAFEAAKNKALNEGQCREGSAKGSWKPCGLWSGMGRVGQSAGCGMSLHTWRRWPRMYRE